MQAIIVAAGEGTRLRPLTEDCPKALLEVGGKSLITRSIEILHAQGVADIILVVGFREEKIKEHLAAFQISWLSNPSYQSNNNMASLRLALPFIKENFLYLHSDLIYAPQLLQQIVADQGPNVLLVERKSCNEEDMKVKVEAGVLLESNKEIALAESFGEWTGIAKFSSPFAKVLAEQIDILLKQGHQKAYDTLAFTQLARKGHTINISPFTGLPWIEIDTLDDLEQARTLFG